MLLEEAPGNLILCIKWLHNTRFHYSSKIFVFFNRSAQVGESPLSIREKLSVQGLVHSEKGLCSHQNQELLFLEYISLWWRWSEEEKSHGFCEQTEWRIRYHLLQILHLQWQRGFQDGIIVFPCGIWKVTKLRSCSHTTPEGFEKAALTVYFGFVFEVNSVRKITWLLSRHLFLKNLHILKLKNVFRPPSVFRFLRFEERFENSRDVTWRASVNGGLNRANKAVFSNFSDESVVDFSWPKLISVFTYFQDEEVTLAYFRMLFLYLLKRVGR